MDRCRDNSYVFLSTGFDWSFNVPLVCEHKAIKSCIYSGFLMVIKWYCKLCGQQMQRVINEWTKTCRAELRVWCYPLSFCKLARQEFNEQIFGVSPFAEITNEDSYRKIEKAGEFLGFGIQFPWKGCDAESPGWYWLEKGSVNLRLLDSHVILPWI